MRGGVCVRLPLRGAVGPFLPRGRITRPESREIPWVYLGQYLGSLSLHKREGELWTEKTSARSGAGQSWLYTRLAGRYLVPSYNRLYVTHMVAGVVSTTRLDSALVTEWPEAIDLESRSVAQGRRRTTLLQNYDHKTRDSHRKPHKPSTHRYYTNYRCPGPNYRCPGHVRSCPGRAGRALVELWSGPGRVPVA